ncbi:hypothetical protein IC229_33710 [Spirosoma sp. BT702]|uniref:Phage tail protein n=1 Tax=Spirosoma profusum TaxID=2771354 RepID=A0A927AWD7_9BACT|nr:hypothetical protein [Spirosoma profusum]MBD2705614.1 hypothetical protein [Spirosoma profusum]
MAAIARTVEQIDGKSINIYFKKPGGSTFILFGCATTVDYDFTGAAIEKTACRAGSKRAASGDIDPPTVTVDSLNRQYASGAVATNISNKEVKGWIRSSTPVDVMIEFGGMIGDETETGTALLSDFSVKGPQEGNSTASFKVNFVDQTTLGTTAAP